MVRKTSLFFILFYSFLMVVEPAEATIISATDTLSNARLSFRALVSTSYSIGATL